MHRYGVACLLLAATIAVQCLAKDASFFEDFGSGWDSRWIQSSDEKYNGKFEVESPKSLNDQALKVKRTEPRASSTIPEMLFVKSAVKSSIARSTFMSCHRCPAKRGITEFLPGCRKL